MEEKIKKRLKVIITSLFVFSSIIVSLVFPQKMNFKEVSKAPSSPVPHFPIQKSLFKSKDDYIKEVREKINGIIFYPQEAKRKNLTGTVKVEFTIDSQGEVQNPHIIQSSGFSTLDDATLFFIKAANTVSSLPSPLFIGEKEIKLVMPIKFSLPSSQERHQRILKALQKESKKSSGRISFMKKKNLGIEENRLLSLLNNEDLKTLFSLAKKNSQPLKVAMDQIYLAQIKTKEAFRNLFPALGVEYTSTKGETIVDPYKSKSYGIKMEHILYDHKQRKFSWQREKINVAIARKNYEKIENNLLFEVLKAYYQVYTEKKALEAIEKAKTHFDEYFALHKNLKKGGLITEVEALKIQSFYYRLESEKTAQESKYRLALGNLKKVTGISPEETLPSLSLTNPNLQKIDVEDTVYKYISLALKKRPEIPLWEKTIQATQLGYKITRVESKPKFIIDSFWGESGEAYGYQKLELAQNWNVVGKVVWLWEGNSLETSSTFEKTVPTEIVEISAKTESKILSLKANLLDKVKYFTELQEGEVAVKQSKDEFIKVKKDIAWEVQEGYSTYQQAKKRENSLRKEIEMEIKELALRKKLFMGGESELSDVMQTELRLVLSRLSLWKSILDKYAGIALLEKATGFNLGLLEKL